MAAETPGAGGAWGRLVVELSKCGDVIETLMATHVPTADGLCRACTTPGQGTPQTPWPCSLWTLADWARKARAAHKAGEP